MTVFRLTSLLLLVLLTTPAWGAHPQISAPTESVNDTNALTQTVTLPATVNAGDLLIVCITVDGTPTLTWPGDWTALVANTTATAVVMGCRYKIADGTEDGTTIDITTNVGEQSTA